MFGTHGYPTMPMMPSSSGPWTTTKMRDEKMNDKQKLNCDYIEVDLEIENKNEFINLIKSKI